MKTVMMALVAAAVSMTAGAQMAQAGERTQEAAIATSGRFGADRGLHQRYCIVDPTMRTPELQRVCHTLAEWEMTGVDPRRMPRR